MDGLGRPFDDLVNLERVALWGLPKNSFCLRSPPNDVYSSPNEISS